VVFTTFNGTTVFQPPAYGEYVTVSWAGSHSLGAGQVITTPTANEDISHANPPTSSTGCPL